MKIQVTLTVEEGKRVIAKGISSLPEVNRVMKEGIILLKGGTTVSAISEALVGIKLRISGRITGRGAVTAALKVDGPHSIVIKRGKAETADGHLEEIVSQMGPKDLAICGANIVDKDGNAAMMAGRFLVASRAESFLFASRRSTCHCSGRTRKIFPFFLKGSALCVRTKRV